MASVLRTKRKVSEDPAEALIVCIKKAKVSQQESTQRFQYAGTVDEKDLKENSVIAAIEEALATGARCSKSERASVAARRVRYRPVDVGSKLRIRHAQNIRHNRDRQLNRYRTVDDADEPASPQPEAPDLTPTLYHLYDVVAENITNKEDVHETPTAGDIACNGVPLVRQSVADDDNARYVYDLFYTAGVSLDNDCEADVVGIEAGTDIIHEEEMCEAGERREESDDEEDSNAEDNRRNDYPDEDSDFEKEYDYYRDYDEDDELYGQYRDEDFAMKVGNLNIESDSCGSEYNLEDLPG